MTGRLCEGRVCVVTGAGRGIGRSHALALAAAGACVVVNDVGAGKDGVGGSSDPAKEVAEAIVELGGVAIPHTGDVSTVEGARGLVELALDAWGSLDVVVNNAGILRDRMLVNLSEDDWDAVLRVHLRSTFLLSREAAAHWRRRAGDGQVNDARIINTTSSSGIFGNVGQSNYGAAKAGIAGFTLIAAAELERYGIGVNALCPTALTRMTEDTKFGESEDARSGVLDPRWVSPVLVWLASPLSAGVTGRVVIASGRNIAIAEGWRRGPTGAPAEDPEQVDAIIRPLLEAARANADMRGEVPA